MQDPTTRPLDPLAAYLPEWTLPTLTFTQWSLVALLGAWLILRLLVWSRRRSLGLRSLEVARKRDVGQPTYRQGIDARKEGMLARGDAYQEARAQRDQSDDSATLATSADDGWTKWISLARIGTLVFAGLNLGVTIVAAVAAGGEVNEMVESISTSERWEAVLQKYWIGLAVAGFIILLEVGRWLNQRRLNPQQPSA